MENILYYELATEYGPLYVYERYNDDPKTSKEIPETREFFTQEEARVSYSSLVFLEKAEFKVVERNMEGIITKNYMHKLSPYEFLNRVGSSLDSDEKMEEKRKRIYDIFEMKSNNMANDQVIETEQKGNKKQKNIVASKILSKYIPSKN